jgi:peptidyl-prolyl cis-trans isomerase C
VRTHAVLVAFVGAGILGACGESRQKVAPPPPVAAVEHWEGSLSPRPTPEAFAVAEVNGDTIWDVDVARHAAARHLGAREALAELIDLQLLAQEAYRRGLASAPEVAEARQQARARALIRAGFESEFKSPADVPESDLDLVWSNQKVYLRFNHQQYNEVRFVRVDVKKDASPAEVALARREADTIHDAVVAAHPETKEAFGDAAIEAGHNLGLNLQALDHSATKGGTVPEFLEVAFALQHPGDISPVSRTPWGWDILYLYNIRPEIHETKEQATPELRKLIFDESRRRAFLRWSDELLRKARITRHDELLRDDPTEPPAAQP